MSADDASFDLRGDEWADPAAVAQALAKGADPNVPDSRDDELVLTTLIMNGTPESLSVVLPRMANIDQLGGGAFDDGRSALWNAVYERRPDMAAVLVAAGADPWLDMMSGWSPGRLALAGPSPDQFGPPPEGVGLNADEQETIDRAQRLWPVCSMPGVGWSFAAAGGISASDVVTLIGARLYPEPMAWAYNDLAAVGAYQSLFDGLGACDVPGGCLIVHPTGSSAATPGLLHLVSQRSRAYGIFDNMASGRQGSLFVRGAVVGWDLCPGGWPDADDAPEQVLRRFLAYQAPDDHAIVEACLIAGVDPDSPRAFRGPFPYAFGVDPDVDWYRFEALQS